MESQNRHLKRRLEQHLILRGSRDFASLEEYDRFVEGVLRPGQCQAAEAPGRGVGVHASAAGQAGWPSIGSMSRRGQLAESDPGQEGDLFGALAVDWAHAAGGAHEAELKVYLGREFLFSLPRLRGDRGALVDFRHVIRASVAQARSLHPLPASGGAVSQRGVSAAYDRLVADHGERAGQSSSICTCSSWRRRRSGWSRSRR